MEEGKLFLSVLLKRPSDRSTAEIQGLAAHIGRLEFFKKLVEENPADPKILQ